jgi:hypothetical protein
VVDKEDQSNLRELIVRGTGIGVAGATVAASYLTEGPDAAIGLLVDQAPLLAETMAWLASDYRDRHMSRRERLRVDAAITFAVGKAYQRIMEGDAVRSDEFFQPEQEGGRRPSEEIAEAVALAVQREPEERKVRHIGFVLGNIGFEPSLDRIAGNSFVRAAEDLSYTQMQLLALVGRRTEVALPPGSKGPVAGVSWKAVSVSRQFMELAWGKKEFILPEKQGPKLPVNMSVPADQRFAPFGEGLFLLMDLASVPIEEVKDVAAALWEASGEEQPPRS